MTESRPPLGPHLSGRELKRWYWLHEELAAFARSLGLAVDGGKENLTARIVAHLDGHSPPSAPPRRPAPPALAEPLTAATLIPAGQRCTQQLRHYFDDLIGSSFTFDATMREFISHGAGKTLGAAADHWYATRSRAAPAIGSQFELNAFLRSWHQRNPNGPRAQALDAWRSYRALPVEARQPP